MRKIFIIISMMSMLNAQPPTAEESFLSYLSAVKNGISFSELKTYFSKAKQTAIEKDISTEVSKGSLGRGMVTAFYMKFASHQIGCHKLTLERAEYVTTNNAILHYKQELASCGDNSFSGPTQDVSLIKEDGNWKIDNIELSLK